MNFLNKKLIGLGLLSIAIITTPANVQAEEAATAEVSILTNDDIHLRDPYILVYDDQYYMYGTRADNCFTDPMDGFDCYVSKDLETWEGPYEIYHNDGSNKATWAYFAPECYYIDGKFYFFCSWREDGSDYEYENILISDSPTGPFEIYAEDILEGIDATLFEEDGKYYMINSHNMTNENRGIYASELSSDFKSIVGEPKLLFTTEGCEWISETSFNGGVNNMTDGPCPYVTSDGTLLIMWSSMDKTGNYNIGICSSDNGRLDGNWTHQTDTFFDGNKGHNMLFTDLNGQLTASMHSPNELGAERPYFLSVEEDTELGTLRPITDTAVTTWNREEIDIRDTYVLTYDGKYYLYGTTGFEAFNGSQSGFRAFVSEDLETFEGPYTIFANDGTSWATQRYWAPEVYEIDGKFYMFAGWSHPSVEQKLCVLTADNPLGPWEILNADLADGNDPTLYQENDTYYLIYNDPYGFGTEHQKRNMMIIELSDDFSTVVGARQELFDATNDDNLNFEISGMPEGWETFVTPTGRLILMWSFQDNGAYTSMLNYFDNGSILGDMEYSNELFTPYNMGHNNFFYSVDGDLMMATHYPNDYDCELGCSFPLFFKVNYDEEKDTLILDTNEFYAQYGEQYSAKFETVE